MHEGRRQVMHGSEVGHWGYGKHMAPLKRVATTTELLPMTVSFFSFSKEAPNLDLYATSLIFSRLAMNSYFFKDLVDQTVFVIGLGPVCGPLGHRRCPVRCVQLLWAPWGILEGRRYFQGHIMAGEPPRA